ncbi:MAG: DUF4276 family protein [Magnetococcus sp. DMHC-6]
MHFEILVEGQSELIALSILMEKIIGPYKRPHTWKIHQHRGIGTLPEQPHLPPNRNDQTLLHNLPHKLRAYGKAMQGDAMVVVLVDLDDRSDCRHFKQQLVELLNSCPTKPTCLFRIAVEELEAWYFGDSDAIRSAYPHAISEILSSYIQDSQCGPWETMADAIYPEGRMALCSSGKRSSLVLAQKLKWTKAIAPKMDVERNTSPSFKCFRDGLRNAIRLS